MKRYALVSRDGQVVGEADSQLDATALRRAWRLRTGERGLSMVDRRPGDPPAPKGGQRGRRALRFAVPT